jgi:hypothetical protein
MKQGQVVTLKRCIQWGKETIHKGDLAIIYKAFPDNCIIVSGGTRAAVQYEDLTEEPEKVDSELFNELSDIVSLVKLCKKTTSGMSNYLNLCVIEHKALKLMELK